jgi:glycosyltransferase involved in cell wall biosynthesis
MRLPRVAMVISHYLPGNRAGGPVRSVANLVDRIGNEAEIVILTADRDFRSTEPYQDITAGRAYQVGRAQVIYFSPEQLVLRSFAKVLVAVGYDLLYLNGAFCAQTRRTLLLRRFGLIPSRPTVVAPRGEFSPGAFALKGFKKRLYLHGALRLGVYDGLTWHVTSDLEKAETVTRLKPFISDVADRVVVASNLLSAKSTAAVTGSQVSKLRNSARIVFLARVSRMKNLAFALRTLSGISAAITFDVFGPLEDRKYWEQCQQIIRRMPPNIQVSYRGEVQPQMVAELLTGYHLFYLPTRGENFGHAIAEAFIAGCPALISDQTPWRDLTKRGVGWDIPLGEPARFTDVLNEVAAMDDAQFSTWSTRARCFGAQMVEDQSAAHMPAYRQLFRTLS